MPPPPPRQPLLSPPATLPVCTPIQNVKNGPSCYRRMLTSAVCADDGPEKCPERCGLCRREFAPRRRSARVRVSMRVGQPVDQFEPMPFRQNFADQLEISVNQIEMALSVGSTVVDMSIVTINGTIEAARSLEDSILTSFSDPTAAAEILGVPLLGGAITGVDVAPPAPPPEIPPPEMTPGGASASQPAVVLGGILSALLVVVAAVAMTAWCVYRKNRSAAAANFSKLSTGKVVFAEFEFPSKRA